MKFKYYDMLSQVVIGYLVLVVILYVFDIKYENSYSVPYLAGAFVIGYFVNSISSLLEDFYYWTMGGRPSDILLRISDGKKYTGPSKVRFYHTAEIIDILRQELKDENANERKMFFCAQRVSSSNEGSRVPTFSAHYALARGMLTTMLLISIILIIKFYAHWETYLVFIPLALSWNRFRVWGYYYAREVLNEYIKQKVTNNH